MDLLRIEQQMQFLIEIDKLKTIIRRNYLTDGSRRENDAEHSWHLAMMVMVLAEYFEPIDIERVLKMVLIHDIVEIYAGDTFAYDMEAHSDKEEREKEAARKIFSLLPEGQCKGFHELWQEFEDKLTNEALCAAIVDRLQPIILNICSNGKTWKENSITLERVLKRNEIIFKKAPGEVSEYIKRKITEAAGNNCFYQDSNQGANV